MSNVDTEITPPEADGDGGEDWKTARLSVHLHDVNDVSYEASVQLFGPNATDPQEFADALLKAVLALASLRGPEHAWAVMQRFTTYDGMPS